jgi:hypothetical protein
MGRTQIEVSTDTRDVLNAARVDLYADAGQVLTADGRLLFLLGFWYQLRLTAEGAEAAQLVAASMAKAGIGRDRRCAG